MSATAHLKDLVDALEMQSDEQPAFLDLDTGEVHVVSLDLLHDAEEPEEEDDPKEGEDSEWDIAKKIVFTDRVVRLPTKPDVDEWGIMEEFSQSVTSGRMREEL